MSGNAKKMIQLIIDPDSPTFSVYCEIGFTERLINDHIFTLTREGNREMGCNVFA